MRTGAATEKMLGALRLGLVLVLGGLPVLHLVVVALATGSEPAAADAWRLDARVLALLARSIAIALGASLGALALGLCIGIPLARVRFSGRSILALLLLAAFAVSPYWLALGWLRGGLGTAAAHWLIGRPAAVAFVLATAYAPAMALLVLLALRSLPIGWEEAALLAAPLRRVLWSVLLPQVLPLLATATLLVFALCFSDYAVASLLQVLTYPVEIFLLYAGAFAPAQAARACLPLLAVAAVTAALAGSLLGRTLARQWPAAVVGSWALTRRQRRGLLGLAFVAVAGSTAWPVFGLSSQVEATTRTLAALHSGASALVNSATVGVFSLVLALTLGSVASGAIARTRPGTRPLLAMLLLLPVCLPDSAYAIAWVELAAVWPAALREGIGRVPALVPALCIAARWTGAVALLVAIARLALPGRALDAARLQERSALRRLVRVELPLVAPVVLATAAILFALSQSAVGILVLTAPPGFEVASLRIDNLLHYGAREQAIALALASAASAAGVPLALAWAARSVWGRLA
jgi:ABC-type Fe3+ transport system permease subunit